MKTKQRPCPPTDIRHPYYDMSDKIWGFRSAIEGDGLVAKDAKLAALVAALQAAQYEVHRHLEATYCWD